MTILHVVEFAELMHRKQVRKYTGEPYIVHPLEVARLVESTGLPIEAVSASLLHDVIEDCGVTREQIIRAFGLEVAQLVHEVTNPATKLDGNRAHRAAINRMHSKRSSSAGATIKLADLISNTRSIVQHDPKFAVVYLAEKRELLEVLRHGDKRLWNIAHSMAWQA